MPSGEPLPAGLPPRSDVTVLPPALKHAIERALVASGAPALTRVRRRSQVLILAYHDIVPDGGTPSGDRSLHLPLATFARQLDALARTHDVIPLAEVIAGAASRTRPAAVITFDDAYRGAVTAGVAELARRGLPATIFVAPAFVGGGTFWWDAIERPPDAAKAERFREYALTALGGDDGRIRQWAASHGHREAYVPDWARCASEDELARAARHPMISFGSHSWSHPNLAALGDERLAEELAAPLPWLRARFHNVVACLAYPYGLFSPTVARAARTAGYQLSLRVDGGWLSLPRLDPMATPRWYVPGEISHAGFTLRAAGILCR